MRSRLAVLLVEDNPDDVDLITYAFRKAQVRNPLEVVSDGEQALEYFAGRLSVEDREQHSLPAVVLLDLKLPRKSGFAVLEWIRASPPLRHLPVVVLTSSSQDEDVRRAYDLCANSYLVKPVRRDALIDMMQLISRYWAHLNLLPA
jgi:CheY-like chemotaxis protein